MTNEGAPPTRGIDPDSRDEPSVTCREYPVTVLACGQMASGPAVMEIFRRLRH